VLHGDHVQRFDFLKHATIELDQFAKFPRPVIIQKLAHPQIVDKKLPDPSLLLGCQPLTKAGGGRITPTFWVFPFHNIEEVVMRLFLVALLLVMSGSAVAQVP
jgi:hypothetical protein